MRNIDITQISEFPFVITGAQAVFDQDGEMLLDENGNPRTVFARSNDIWDENEGKTQSDLNKELKSAKPAIATITTPGIVQPDGDTITVDANGKIKVKGGGSSPVPEGVLTKDDVQNTLNAEGQSEMVDIPLSAAAGYRLNQRLAQDIPVADGVTITVDKDQMPRVAKAFTAAVTSTSKQLATGAQIYTAIHSEIEGKVDEDTITIVNGKLAANVGESTANLATKGQVSAAISTALAGFSPSGGGVNVIGSESILITPGENASTISANVDTKATANSGKLLTSGTIYTALKEVTDSIPQNTDDIDYYQTRLTDELDIIEDALWARNTIDFSKVTSATSTTPDSWSSDINDVIFGGTASETTKLAQLFDSVPVAVLVQLDSSKTQWSLGIASSFVDGYQYITITLSDYIIKFRKNTSTGKYGVQYSVVTVEDPNKGKVTTAEEIKYLNASLSSKGGISINNVQNALDSLENNVIFTNDVAYVTSLQDLPVDKYSIVATINSIQTGISFNGTPKNGQEYTIEIINDTDSVISQPLPMTLTSSYDNNIVWQSDNTGVDIDPYAISEISIKVVKAFRKFKHAVYQYATWSTSSKAWTVTDTIGNPSDATTTIYKGTSDWDSENNIPTATPTSNVIWRVEEDQIISGEYTTYYIKS